MTGENPEDKAAQASADNALLVLQAKVAELEKVVHALAQGNPNAGHGVVVTWLERVGERIKETVEKVV